MDFSIRVSDAAFEYLKLQKGSLEPYAHERAEWHRRYETDLRETYEAIAPELPLRPLRAEPIQLLDVGSGLGGIDVLIRRHYRGVPLDVHLLDGTEDLPVMKLHRQTFNNMAVAREFQLENGLDLARFHSWPPGMRSFGRYGFDLVVSFGSWCFHYPPSVYLPRLLAGGVRYGAVIICDVRANKPEWMAQLVDVFGAATVIAERPKWFRCVFRQKAR